MGARPRSVEGSIRSVTFTAGVVTIDVEIHQRERERLLLGQLSPAARATIEVQRDDDSRIAAAQADALGRFRLTLAGGGTIRLLVTGDEPGATVIETAWIAV